MFVFEDRSPKNPKNPTRFPTAQDGHCPVQLRMMIPTIHFFPMAQPLLAAKVGFIARGQGASRRYGRSHGSFFVFFR